MNQLANRPNFTNTVAILISFVLKDIMGCSEGKKIPKVSV